MTDHNKDVSKQDRKRTVLEPEACELALQIFEETKLLNDINDQMVDIHEEFQLAKAKFTQKEGRIHEVQTMFWKAVRKSNREWMREMREAGLLVTFEKLHDPDGEEAGIGLRAYDPHEEALKAVNRFHRNDQG